MKGYFDLKHLKNICYLAVLVAIMMGFFSCKQLKLEDADHKFSEGQYFAAADMYRQIYRKLPPKDRDLRGQVAFRMGESYRLLNYSERAVGAYANAERYRMPDSILALQYARTLQKTANYKGAKIQYQKFLTKYPNNRFAKNGIEGCEIALGWKVNPTKYVVKRVELFNSNAAEFSPVFLPPDYDQVFFTSNRKGTTGDTISFITGARLNDVFMSRKDESGKWMKPEHVDSPINSPGDEGVGSISGTGNALYYTHCPLDTTNKSVIGIYVARRSSGSWGTGTRIDINKRDTTSVFAHPAISPDGDWLYFVSDMKGGYGGKDIWRASMVGDMVDYYENLGPEINTAGDEMFPVVRNDSTIYFSSDGHVGMGGLDIYKATLKSGERNWKVENMKSPINSSADDFGITFEGEAEKGFFSSNRGDAKGYDHIYSFVYPVVTAKAEGFIVDTDDEFIQDAVIRVVGKDGTNKRIIGKNNGTYSMEVSRGTDYVFLASAKNFLNTRMSLKTSSMERDTTYLVDFVLTPIHKPVVLENIFYDFNKATLRSESKKELDGLIALLKDNPNVSIELSAHTDRKGSDEYNNKLSQQRAESVVHYLAAGGIEKGRLVAVGKGKSEPKVVTKAITKKYSFLKEGDVLTEEFVKELSPEQQAIADQVNRRTEFKVLSITYNLE